MEKKHATHGKFKAFLKKNVYYIIMGICLLAIAAMVTVALVTRNKNDGVVDVVGPGDNIQDNVGEEITPPADNKEPDDVPTSNPDPIVPPPVAIVFACPVNDVNILQDYSMDSLVWHNTLKHYAVHKGIDFAGEDGTDVMSVYSGVVSNITYDVLNGYTVTITHNDKLTTTYSSLNEPTVVIGEAVRKGEKIGTMGVTATSEYLDGAHVHFCLYEDGVITDPKNYLSLGDK